MSTRSLVGTGHLESFQARYVHSNGYPTWRGHDLWGITRERGLVEGMSVLLEHSWSFIYSDADLIAARDRFSDIYPPLEAYEGLPGRCYCHLFTDHRDCAFDYKGSRHKEGYSHHKAPPDPGCQCRPRRENTGNLLGPEHLSDTWCEWMYLLGEDQKLRVYKLGEVARWYLLPKDCPEWNEHAFLVSVVDFSEGALEPDWEQIENSVQWKG